MVGDCRTLLPCGWSLHTGVDAVDRKRGLAALVGALALAGVSAAHASDTNANNDPTGAVRDGTRFLAVSNSTIRLNIKQMLLNNDHPSTARFVRAFKIPGSAPNNPSSAGIRSLRVSDNGKVLLVRLREFVGDTSFKYVIRSRRAGSQSRANVFINVLPSISPTV